MFDLAIKTFEGQIAQVELSTMSGSDADAKALDVLQTMADQILKELKSANVPMTTMLQFQMLLNRISTLTDRFSEQMRVAQAKVQEIMRPAGTDKKTSKG